MDKTILTAIDANLNRAIEGLRVCEDIFRFSYRNIVSEEIKKLRHNITEVSRFIDRTELLASRDIDADSQKFFDTSGEKRREGTIDLFRANIRRAAEALRVLEEFSKMIDPDISVKFQKIRFKIYDIEQQGEAIILKHSILGKFKNSLYAIIDSAFVPLEQIDLTTEILSDSGADIIQLRIKNINDSKLVEYATSFVKTCRERGVVSIINDRVDIAILSKADGVHLGPDDLPVSGINKIAGNSLIIGFSAGGINAAEDALISDADYIAIGPVFKTSSKNGFDINGIGTDVLKEICSKIGKTVVAIGGINSENVEEVLISGCSCIAVISELYKDGMISENTKKLKSLINQFTELPVLK